MNTDNKSPAMHRKLKNRHMQMIALGAAVGTGLFYGSAPTIQLVGPGIILSYLLTGIFIFFVMRMLGEMTVREPVSASFSHFAGKYWHPFMGYLSGWNYWTLYMLAGMAELAAIAVYMNYWFPSLPQWLSTLICIVIITGINLSTVRAYGEAEFWASFIKIGAIVAMILFGFYLIFATMGAFPQNFSNLWTNGGFFPNGGWGFLCSLAIVMFSFGGVELIGITAGEAQDPQRTIPKAIKQIFWRILIFYVLSIIMIGLLLPYNDPRLLQSSVKDIAVSPFTLVLQATGVPAAASVMNAVILTAILSAGNSGMYASTRTLHAMAMQGQAPKVFARVSRRGVPVPALLLTTAVSALCFTSSLFGDQRVYLWLVNLTGLCGFIAWLGIAISHYRFRKGFLAQGRSLDELPYRARWFPFGPLFAFTLCLIVVLGQNYEAFFASRIDWNGIIATYIGIPVYLAVWLGYRWKHRCRFVRYEDMLLPERCEKTTN